MKLKIKEAYMEAGEKPGKKTRVYFFVEGENVLENLANRRFRPYKEYRKLLPEVFQQLNIDEQKANWSQYAGCSCPCSPGFILQDHYGHQVFVTIIGEN